MCLAWTGIRQTAIGDERRGRACVPGTGVLQSRASHQGFPFPCSHVNHSAAWKGKKAETGPSVATLTSCSQLKLGFQVPWQLIIHVPSLALLFHIPAYHSSGRKGTNQPHRDISPSWRRCVQPTQLWVHQALRDAAWRVGDPIPLSPAAGDSDSPDPHACLTWFFNLTSCKRFHVNFILISSGPHICLYVKHICFEDLKISLQSIRVVNEKPVPGGGRAKAPSSFHNCSY